jgi:hypothetical protein
MEKKYWWYTWKENKGTPYEKLMSESFANIENITIE